MAGRIQPKRVCKEDGTLFTAWCESSECPVGYKTAQQLISVHAELGGKKEVNLLFKNGLDVLGRVTQTREEDIRQARRLFEVFGERREEVAFIPQSGLYALAEPKCDEYREEILTTLTAGKVA